MKRRPGVNRGAILIPRVIEFFFKDDANHDPLIEPDAIVAQNIATPQELGVMSEIARIVYEILAHAWRRRDTLLVDMKIEFGRIASGEGKGNLVVADVIDNDAWRIWPQGREELMLDKQAYRNLETVTPADLAAIKANYEQVAEIAGTFPLMRPGMVAVVADGNEFVERSAEIARALGAFGLPSVRHVASATRTPGYVLQLITQLDATFARLIFVTVGSGDGVLANMIEYASTTPVVRAPAVADVNLIALQCAKAFSLEDSVVFGRVHAHASQHPFGGLASRRGAQRTPDGVSVDLAADTDRLIAERARIGVALSPDELRTIVATLGRIPTDTELFAFDAQWSEHCSYKSSRHHLRKLPVDGPTVMQGPAEDAGILHLGTWEGERYGVVIAHESHNHPSQVVPFEGAATGVGGIVRDVLCMGAEVIGIADPLRFGRLDDSHCRYVAQSVVDGIAAYGNAIGVPNLGGDVYIDESFDDNVLVNVVALGLIKETEIIHSYAPKDAVGYDIVLVGKATDRSGFGGASFSSITLDDADAEANKGAVQVPDPFLKNVIMRASYKVFAELRRLGIEAGYKDLGAGGFAGCSAELCAAGGVGAEVELDRVLVSQADLPPAVIAIGETQERLCWIVPPDFTPLLLAIYNEEFSLPRISRGAGAAIVGKVTAGVALRCAPQGRDRDGCRSRLSHGRRAL